MRKASTFEGRECVRGCGCTRYVSNRLCVKCQNAATRKYRSLKGDEHRANARRHSAARRLRMPEEKLWRGAKDRAAEKGLPFSISVSDIVIPSTCPLLEIPLRVGSGRVTPNSPTVDRISNDRGYVPGNVWVVSNAANTCKGALNASTILHLGVRLRLMENSIVL